jgi:hypothetical protein
VAIPGDDVEIAEPAASQGYIRPEGPTSHKENTMAKYLLLKHYRGAPAPVNNIPMEVMLPYCDGDVSDLEGVHYVDDTLYERPSDPAYRDAALRKGADDYLIKGSIPIEQLRDRIEACIALGHTPSSLPPGGSMDDPMRSKFQ